MATLKPRALVGHKGPVTCLDVNPNSQVHDTLDKLCVYVLMLMDVSPCAVVSIWERGLYCETVGRETRPKVRSLGARFSYMCPCMHFD